MTTTKTNYWQWAWIGVGLILAFLIGGAVCNGKNTFFNCHHGQDTISHVIDTTIHNVITDTSYKPKPSQIDSGNDDAILFEVHDTTKIHDTIPDYQYALPVDTAAIIKQYL